MAEEYPSIAIRKKINEALEILSALDLPSAQINERSALVILALGDIRPEIEWKYASSPLLGITPMMNWFREYYQKRYAPNSRETIRRFTMHQFMEAGIALYNPDCPDRPVNSPASVYQISPEALELVRAYGTPLWEVKLLAFLDQKISLRQKYANERNMAKIPVLLANGVNIELSPGKHSNLIKDIINEFAPRFAPGSEVVYIGDTGEKWACFDRELLASLGVSVDIHGKMPDVVLYSREKHWLFLVESVTSHGPVNAKRVAELKRLFIDCTAELIFVTAFPNHTVMSRFLADLAWESEVWIADSPAHLIHFNGTKFLGPY